MCMKYLYIHQFPFKNVISLTIDKKNVLQNCPKRHCLGCISKQAIRQALRCKDWIRLNSSKKSFPLPTNRKLSFVLNFLNNLYNEWKCQERLQRSDKNESAKDQLLLKLLYLKHTVKATKKGTRRNVTYNWHWQYNYIELINYNFSNWY